MLLAMWPVLQPGSVTSTNTPDLPSSSLEETASSPRPSTPGGIPPNHSIPIDPYLLQIQYTPLKMEDEDRNTVTTIPSREDEQSPAATTKNEDNTTFEALCAPFLSNTPAPRPLVISPSMLSNFESHVLAAIPDLLTKVVVPAPVWARHWVIWHEALNPELVAATTRILFDKIKRYNYQLPADATPEKVHAMKVLKADTGAIKAYLSMRVDTLDLGNKRSRRVALSEAYLRLANYDKIDYISADYIHTSIIECYKYAVEDFKAAKAAARGSLMMPEDLTKLQQALNLLKTRLVKGLGILGARPTHLPPIAAKEEPQPQTARRKPMVSRWAPKQSYTSFPAPVFEAEKERLEAEQKLHEEEGRGPLKLAPAVCPVHLQWHLEHIRKPNVTKSQLLARLKKYQQDYALGSFSPHRNWTKVSAGGIVALMEHIEQRITQDEYIPEDSPEKEADFNDLPDNDRIATYEERLPLPTPTEEDMMRALKNVNDLTRDHAMKIYDVILKCIDGSEGDLKDQCANFRRECLEICRDIMFGRIQKDDFGPPPEEVARQAQGLGPNTSIAGKQDFNKLAVNHGTASDIQRKRQASPGAMVPNPIKKEPSGYSKDGPLAKPMAPSATLPEVSSPLRHRMIPHD
jgi:hypothetical protein